MQLTPPALILGLGLPCALTAQGNPIEFTDVTAAAGIDWQQRENNSMLGSGGAFLDYDGDGWQDILLSGGIATPALYRNVGGARFEPVPQAVFPRTTGWAYMCVTVGDIDNDGDPDVFLGRWGTNLLFRNDGGGVFTDITTPLLAGQREFTTTAAFGDYDQDGILDLFVGNYIERFNYPFHGPATNRLFHGNGDGTFANATSATLAGAGTALASTWTDFDADGDPDLWLCNDFGAFVEPNRVYRNDGPGAGGTWQFTEVSRPLGADLKIYCMGIAIGDIDRDRDFDYYFTNLGRNVMLRNDGSTFVDIATPTGTELTLDPTTQPPLLATSWGCGLHDFDLDGWLDLYVSNGHIPAAPEIANGQNTPNALFRHDGAALTFTEMPLGLDTGVGRGCAFADYDRDGDIDILQCNIDAVPNLLRNDSPNQGAWFAAKLAGRISNRDALGARLDLDCGDFVACREVSRNDSFESSSQVAPHFGLGAATHVRELAVRWPSGIEQQVYDLPTGIELPLVEPLVTANDPVTRVVTLPTGKRLEFEATLVNGSSTPVTAYYFPQLRVGYDDLSNPATGATVWRAALTAVALNPGERHLVTESLFLPRGAAVPAQLNLDFVWTVADAAIGVDEAKVAVRLN